MSDPSRAISLPFASLDVSSWRAAGVEQLGTKPKQRLRDDRDRLWLWKGAANVNDVAAAMVECGEGITTMRLEKLAYYCEAWHLASTLQPLFSAEIQAFRDGPVVRELFARHKGRRAVDQWNGSTPPPYSLPGTSRVLRMGISGMTMLITNANRAIPIAM